MAEWPPLAVYAIIAVSCVVENFFPPSPSDVFVALAAFLSHRGSFSPLAIFLTAWLGGISGAVVVYSVARRFAGAFSASRTGRWLLPPKAVAFFQKEYRRFGVVGIFITRLLPGFRSAVAPFAGLVRLSFLQTILPVVLASGLWYATLTWIGVRIGSEWEAIRRVLNHLNTTLAAIAGVLAVALIVLLILRRRRAS